MILRHLELHHFRNFTHLRHEFSPDLNLLVGANAQGKSGILEAALLLATSKSMRGSRDAEMVQWDEPACLVRGSVLRSAGGDVDLEVSLSASQAESLRAHAKSLVVNHQRVTRAQDFIGQLKAVAFCPADLEVVQGEPSRRRRFLDIEISQLSPAYCQALVTYRRIVEQRNRVLRRLREQGRREGDDLLATWTDQLVSQGTRLVLRRHAFLRRLDMLVKPLHEQLTGGRDRLTVSYRGSFKPPEVPSLEGGPEAAGTGPLETAFREALREVSAEEIRRMATLVGPHRDDVLFLLNGREARVYGSQGQQRTVMLAARLAEIDLLAEAAGEAPICLLDDVFSELDASRRAHLLDATLGRCQTLLTTTDLALVPLEVRRRATVMEVEAGSLRPLPEAGGA